MSKFIESGAKLLADTLKIQEWTRYPEGYNRAEHGPYNPGRYYGKPDTPFSQVKLNELVNWVRRRNIGFRPTTSLLSRAYWRWHIKYCQSRKAGTAPVYQVAVFGLILGYTINYLRLRGHRNYKYH